METLGILGFLLILGSWFAMYSRVRREHPQHRLARYGNYIGIHKGAAWRLVAFYRQEYGFDIWLWGLTVGAVIVAVVVVQGIGR